MVSESARAQQWGCSRWQCSLSLRPQAAGQPATVPVAAAAWRVERQLEYFRAGTLGDIQAEYLRAGKLSLVALVRVTVATGPRRVYQDTPSRAAAASKKMNKSPCYRDS